MTPRAATFLMFVVNGVVVGTWIASIPGLQASMDASATEIGLVLLCSALGGLVAQQVTGQLLVRVSSRRVLLISGLVFPLLLPLPIMASSPIALALIMFIFGYANSTMDVAMNAHGVALERSGGVSIFSRLHAGWSIGGAIGAVGVALAVVLKVDALLEAVTVAAACWVVALVVGRYLGVGSVKTDGAAGIHWPSRAVLPIALLVALIALVEGGLSDWGGIYVRATIGSPAEIAALAYGALALGLTIGRIGGDAVKDRIGSNRMIQLGMYLAAAAIIVLLVFGDALIALIGLVAVGIGIANAIPQLFGAAARIAPHGPSLSAAFTFLTFAFIAGPPIIGALSDAIGMTAALSLLAVASVVVALSITHVPQAETSARFRISSPAAGADSTD